MARQKKVCYAYVVPIDAEYKKWTYHVTDDWDTAEEAICGHSLATSRKFTTREAAEKFGRRKAPRIERRVRKAPPRRLLSQAASDDEINNEFNDSGAEEVMREIAIREAEDRLGSFPSVNILVLSQAAEGQPSQVQGKQTLKRSAPSSAVAPPNKRAAVRSPNGSSSSSRETTPGTPSTTSSPKMVVVLDDDNNDGDYGCSPKLSVATGEIKTTSKSMKTARRATINGAQAVKKFLKPQQV